MDVLSDVLRAVRLTGAMYFDTNARAPWVAETPPMATIREKVMPGFDHVMCFHVLLDGGCWAQLADESEPPAKLERGDAVLFPGGDAHFMTDELGRRSKPQLAMFDECSKRPQPFVLRELGGAGAHARFVCGYLGSDARPFNPILSALPRMLHVRSSSVSGRLTRDLISVALTETEAPVPGGKTILSKLSELMFLHAVRQHIDSLPSESTGWLGGLRDRSVGAALRLMHERPADAWSLDALAREVGMSRSAFADRFARIMGVPAMQYLGNWRLQLAARLLQGRRLSIAQAAAEVGYASEAAFNRAFKRQVGVPPGTWRRAREAAERAEGPI
jgi:AraC-like DNA-binding protein